MPPSGTSASCLPADGSMIPRERDPLFAVSRVPEVVGLKEESAALADMIVRVMEISEIPSGRMGKGLRGSQYHTALRTDASTLEVWEAECSKEFHGVWWAGC